MKRLFSVFLIMLPLALSAQKIPDGSMWYDGLAQYLAKVRAGGKIVYFSGGTPHEGGYEFTLERVSEGKYKIIPSRQAEDFSPVGNHGWRVEYIRRDGVHALIVRNDAGLVSHVLEITAEDGYDNMVADNLSVFRGTYSEEQVGFLGHGKEYVIDYRECRLGKKSSLQAYEFVEEYHMPTNVIKTGGKMWMLVPTLLGMNIYPAKMENVENCVKAGPAVSVYWSDHTKGRFCIASERLLNTGILCHYNREALRLMRNEILARHGYRFKSEELSDYFFKQDWYNPGDDNDAIQLSTTEELNISLIKAEEAKSDDDRFTAMED